MFSPNWVRVRHLVGETMREIGTLVLVFAPLDTAFAEQPIRVGLLAAVMAASSVAIVVGIVVEAGE